MTEFTTARVGLGRAGTALPTSVWLTMQADHALARDAVHADFDVASLTHGLTTAGIAHVLVATGVTARDEYLRRPDLGRRLGSDLPRGQWDLVVVVSDGLSATAVNTHGLELVTALLAELPELRVAPVVIAPFARVGLLNEVGAAIGARAAAIVLGERPGLSAPDSLSLYFEMAPTPGLTDADRNCLSNIRPTGLPVDVAAQRGAVLIRAGLRQGISGTALKVEYEPLPRLGS